MIRTLTGFSSKASMKVRSAADTLLRNLIALLDAESTSTSTETQRKNVVVLQRRLNPYG